jgi:hypothetical protein
MGHALMENRNGLVVDACLTEADGHAERVAALALIEPRADRPGRITLGSDNGYDTENFVNELRSMNVTPHVALRAPAPPAMAAPPGMRAMPSASASASGSRRSLAGARPSARSPGPCCAAPSVPVRSLPSRWPDTMSPGCQSGWLHDKAKATLASKGDAEQESHSAGAAFSAVC